MGNEVIIRNAALADAPGVARVHVDAWRTTYRGLVPDEHLAGLSYEKRDAGFQRWFERIPIICVAEDPAAGIVGFATGGPDTEENDPIYKGRLYAIYIVQQHQRRGIGRQIVQHVAGRLADMGLCSVLIWVLSKNTHARRFYEVLGGQVVRTKMIEIGGWTLEETAYGWTDISSLCP